MSMRSKLSTTSSPRHKRARIHTIRQRPPGHGTIRKTSPLNIGRKAIKTDYILGLTRRNAIRFGESEGN